VPLPEGLNPNIHHPHECIESHTKPPEVELLDVYKEFSKGKNVNDRNLIQNTYMSLQTPFGKLVQKRHRMMYPNQDIILEEDEPKLILNNRDYINRIGFPRLKKDRMESMSLWKSNDVIGNNRMRYIKEI
jgi:hypothetical protein